MGALASKAGLNTGENPCTWRSPRNALNLVGTFFFFFLIKVKSLAEFFFSPLCSDSGLQ